MNLRELEYITTIADEKNLTKAAEKVFVSPSALTQQVLKLEKELNTSLFIRTRNGWVPTEAGEIYLSTARKILMMKHDAYKQIQDLAARKTYSISMGIPPERGSDIFSAVYPNFNSRYPDVHISLVETSVFSQQEMISTGKLDIGFMTLAEEQKTSDEYVLLCNEEILLAVPDFYPDRLLKSLPPKNRGDYRVVSLERLANEPFAMMRNTSTLRAVQEKIFSNNNITPIVNFETTRARTIFEMISKRLCCSLICDYYTRFNSLKKVKIYAMPDHPCWQVVASYRKGRYLTEAEQYLIQLVREFFQNGK